MATIIIEIKIGNDGMQTCADVGNALLRKVEYLIDQGPRLFIEDDCGPNIKDRNGNTVGHMVLDEDD